MPADQRISLLPGFVFALGVLLDVSRRQLVERSLAALGLALGGRVLALGDLEHDAARQLARIGEANRGGITDVIPARPTAQRIDALPSLAAGRQHDNGEAALFLVPDHEGIRLRV